MLAAYRDFKKQHPGPIPATPPYAPTGSKHEPVSPVAGPVPPRTLLLAPLRSQTHADHPHPPRGEMAHTEAPGDSPRPTKGPP